MCLPWNRKSHKKTKIGTWAKYVFAVLQHGKKLRGKVYDPLGVTYERRLERKIRDHYIKLVNEWIENIKTDNYSNIEGQAKLPDNIRGYGHIKLLSIRNCELFKDVI
jgi:indolepyruvate ferredoxin oxidoreductase